jgi:hypothetical protein
MLLPVTEDVVVLFTVGVMPRSPDDGPDRGGKAYSTRYRHKPDGVVSYAAFEARVCKSGYADGYTRD